MIKNIVAKIKEKFAKISILDKYILKQVIEMFIMGVFVFTTIIFASDTFITLIKQIAKFGIPFKIADLAISFALYISRAKSSGLSLNPSKEFII